MDKTPWNKPSLIVLFKGEIEGKLATSWEAFQCHYHRVAGKMASAAMVQTYVMTSCMDTRGMGRWKLADTNGSVTSTFTFGPS